MEGLILAGGKGVRLRPYSTILPKPLMPVGDLPILEIVIRQLKKSGCKSITMAVGHLAELIQAYFKDGSRWGVKINYFIEDSPLGTAGAISAMKPKGNNFIVMNGDVLVNLNYREMYDFHKKHKALVTVGVTTKDVPITLGVLQIDKQLKITDYIEKPTLKYKVSMGIYMFHKKVKTYLKRGQHCDLPELIKVLVQKKEKVIAFAHDGLWFDIGRIEDYDRAVDAFMQNEKAFRIK